MSLWEDGWSLWQPRASFTEAVADPGTAPGVGPFICVRFNQEWLPLVVGSLLQLCQPPSWAVSDPAALDDLLGRATALLNIFGLAEACPVSEDGIATLTIAAGQASVSVPIVFVQTYATPPLVDCSCDNPDVIASWSEVTTTGCVLTITAATPVIVSTMGDVSWSTDAA